MRVRRARPEDAGDIVGFQIRMARETEGLALEPRTVADGARAVFEDPAKGTYWVADEDGVTVGALLAIPEWSDWRNGTVLWIHSLYVVPEARRRGVFTALFTALRDLVRRSPDLKGLRLYVDRRNRTAQEAYRALGMSDEHYLLVEWLEGE